ncbi:hypothetical protein [Thermomonas sp.]|uniref:hypothetical protein n=1 Tax=Thermomonas sp. TaxID=1971895 RepID=UPI001D765B8D|nr:hypothetical protein [Thermomonas sp.]MBZ0088440.1 hypothetical protein [Thermomonas sp.]MCO5054478.1 hypothetical protein [Thermomonas sp.]HRO63888.1 hypothetical protein [Thermomonas sp.]
MKPFRWLVLIFLAVVLGACASGGPLVTQGRTTAGSHLTIDAGMEWTRMGGLREQLWTIDGPLLNTLYLIPTVRDGDFVFLGRRQTKRRPDGAFYHRGMRPDELRDLIADGMRAAGAVNVTTSDLRPATFGNREGLRFDMTLDSDSGLKYRAMVAAFEHEKGLALAMFYAPAEYYYPRDAAKVSLMLDSLRWK